jgi:hypothetical protein
MPLNPRAGRPRQRAVDAYRVRCQAASAHCWLCGHPIDYGLERHRHPLRFTVDDEPPLARGGDPLNVSGYRPAHACCNSSRGDRPPTAEVTARCLSTYRRHAKARTRSAAW